MTRKCPKALIFLSFVLFILTTLVASAKNDSHASPGSFRDYLQKRTADRDTGDFPSKRDQPRSPEEFLLRASTRILTDDVRNALEQGKILPSDGRDFEKANVMDVMVRSRGKSPVLVGRPGTGKTAIAYMLAQDILNNTLPTSEIYRSELENAEIIETTPARISQMALSDEGTAQAAAVELYFEAVRMTEKRYIQKWGRKKNIIVVIDEANSFDPPQLSALKTVLEDSINPVRVVLAGQSELIDAKLKKVPEIKKLLQKVPVHEFSAEQTKTLLKTSYLPELERQFNVIFSDDAIDSALRSAAHLYPEIANPEASFRIIEDIAIKTHRKAEGDLVEVSNKDVFDYLKDTLRFPVNPFDHKAIDEYIANLRTELKKRVANQEAMINALLDLWRQVLTGDPRRPLVLLVIGPTGSGKTLLLQSFAELAFGNKNRIFEIQGNTLMDGGYSKDTYFGTPTGVDTKSNSSGKLMEWLDDPSRGQRGGLIAIDEFEKAHSDFSQRLMEFFDRGELPGGDGRVRYGNHHIIVLTSNKGAREIFPPAVKLWSAREIEERVKGLTESDIKNYFSRPDPDNPEKVLPVEVMGRITRAVVSNPITQEQAPYIGMLEVKTFADHYYQTHKIRVNVSQELAAHLAITGIDTLEGGRPMRNQIHTFLGAAISAAQRKWNINHESELNITLVPEEPGAPAKMKVTFQNESLTVEAPQRPHLNPLTDPRIQKMLLGLEGKMLERIAGQPEAVAIASSAIKAKFGDASRSRPVVLLFIGSTGGGKTELGKAIAYAMYGSAERHSILPIGEIRNDKNFDKFFGNDDSKILSVFEAALASNPQGGVIIGDEISNMGGGNIENKEALIKRLYTITEEGFWISPKTGRLYDLRRYIFIFTGNDLEKVMQGLRSDTQRMAAWQKLRNPEVVHEELVKSGIPEAFLGRQDAVVVFRPLVGPVKDSIANKLLSELKVRFENQHVGATLVWDQEFESSIARAFFSHSTGARSIRKVIENQIADLLTTTLLDFGYDEKKIAGLQIKLAMSDNLPKTFVEKVPEREVIISANLERNGQSVFVGKTNVSNLASRELILTENQARIGAFHHIGHVVTNDETLTHRIFKYMTVRGLYIDGTEHYGYSDYENGNGSNLTRKNVEALLTSYWGGRIAQERAGFDPDSGWESDLAEMRRIATKYFLKFGLHDGMESIEVNERGQPVLSPDQKKDLREEMQKLFDSTRKKAEQMIEASWPNLEKAVEEVLKHQDIEADRLHAILKGPKPLNSCGKILN